MIELKSVIKKTRIENQHNEKNQIYSFMLLYSNRFWVTFTNGKSKKGEPESSKYIHILRKYGWGRSGSGY